jgi:hypothetical protein
VRAQADLAVVAEDRAGEAQQRALQVAERQALVDRQALDLVELRRVRRVVVGPVDAPGTMMYSGGPCSSICRTCIGEVCVRRTTSSAT